MSVLRFDCEIEDPEKMSIFLKASIRWCLYSLKVTTNNAGYTEKLKNNCYLSLGVKIETLLLTCLMLVSCVVIPAVAETTLHFTDQTQQAGIHFKHTNGASEQKYLPETMGAGGLFFDYNNDGYLDIYLVIAGPSAVHPNCRPDILTIQTSSIAIKAMEHLSMPQ